MVDVQRLDDLVVRHLRLPHHLAGRLRRRRSRRASRRSGASRSGPSIPTVAGVGDRGSAYLPELVPPLRLGRHHRHGQVLGRERRPEEVAHERDELGGLSDWQCPRFAVVRVRSAPRSRPAEPPRWSSCSRTPRAGPPSPGAVRVQQEPPFVVVPVSSTRRAATTARPTPSRRARPPCARSRARPCSRPA